MGKDNSVVIAGGKGEVEVEKRIGEINGNGKNKNLKSTTKNLSSLGYGSIKYHRTESHSWNTEQNLWEYCI